MALLLGIDLGTTYFKVGLFDERGALQGLGRVAVEAEAPAPGRAELPVGVFWQRLRRALAEALEQAGASAGRIDGISYSSQAGTFVLLDRDLAPLTPLVLWTDSRGDPEDEALGFSRTDVFRRTAGFGELGGDSSVAKWRWFQAAQPKLWAQVGRIMTLSDYLTFALTGEPAGDASTAALLGLYDLHARDWWPDALQAFGIEREKLSTPLRPGSPCSRTIRTAAETLGLREGIPFAVGGLDHHVAAIGSGLGPGVDVSISTGTVLAALTLTGRVSPRPACYHGPHVDGVRYYRLAYEPNGAGRLDDYRRRFAPDKSLEQLIALAAGNPSGGGAAGHGPAVRRILEEIGFAHRRLVKQAAGGEAVRTVAATGGGARSAAWLQITADILGVPVLASSCAEPGCLGAAVFAAAAAGIHAGVEEAARGMARPDRRFEPAARGDAS